MDRVLSCGNSRWRICWWIKISGLVDLGTKPTGVSDEEWKKLDQKTKSTI